MLNLQVEKSNFFIYAWPLIFSKLSHDLLNKFVCNNIHLEQCLNLKNKKNEKKKQPKKQQQKKPKQTCL